jgi:ribonuclease HI
LFTHFSSFLIRYFGDLARYNFSEFRWELMVGAKALSKYIYAVNDTFTLSTRKGLLMLKIYSDGASRGNPGPSAIAFIILDEDDKVLEKYSQNLGIGTNNQAEYQALISALEHASTLGSSAVTCYLDSELVVKQLNGEYEVRKPELRALWRKAMALKMRFSKINVRWVPRTDRHIQEVDCLVNQLLDDKASQQ